MHVLTELHYLAPIPWFVELVRADVLVLEQCENYRKGSYRNRCHILAANGMARLSIPLEQGKNQQQNIREVRIAYYEAWQRQHWHSIKSAYGNAPFFEHYADLLRPFYERPYPFLFDFNLELLHSLLHWLHIHTPLQYSTQYFKTEELPPAYCDKRNALRPGQAYDRPTLAYNQVFEDRFGFVAQLSILDALFCLGPKGTHQLLQRTLAAYSD